MAVPPLMAVVESDDGRRAGEDFQHPEEGEREVEDYASLIDSICPEDGC